MRSAAPRVTAAHTCSPLQELETVDRLHPALTRVELLARGGRMDQPAGMVFIRGTSTRRTGLHIGGAARDLDVCVVDAPAAEPVHAGSPGIQVGVLCGKLRWLLERSPSTVLLLFQEVVRGDTGSACTPATRETVLSAGCLGGSS